jgi:nucleoside-diphosphate-sugar epimerase
MMRVLVIGGTGFIGPYVARELCQRNHELTLYHRGDHETVLAPGARRFKSEKAAMPVVDFPHLELVSDDEAIRRTLGLG